MSNIKEQILKKTTEPSNEVDANDSPSLSFLQRLQDLINKHSKESDSDTPDFILAQYLNNCLTSFNSALKQRSNWYSKETDFDSQSLKEQAWHILDYISQNQNLVPDGRVRLLRQTLGDYNPINIKLPSEERLS